MPANDASSQELFPELALPAPEVLWLPTFLSEGEHSALFDYCRDDIAWERKTVTWQGRTVAIPRLLAWYGDVEYAYSGVVHPARPMPLPLLELKRRIEQLLAVQGVPAVFNSVLLNYYRDGNDSIGMHADDERELGPQPVIASVSLGATRTFKLVHGATRTKCAYALQGGALLVMKGDTQDAWKHGIPKEPGAGPRINLTFRLTRR